MLLLQPAFRDAEFASMIDDEHGAEAVALRALQPGLKRLAPSSSSTSSCADATTRLAKAPRTMARRLTLGEAGFASHGIQ